MVSFHQLGPRFVLACTRRARPSAVARQCPRITWAFSQQRRHQSERPTQHPTRKSPESTPANPPRSPFVVQNIYTRGAIILLFVALGLGTAYYVERVSAAKAREDRQKAKAVGKPQIGGPFNLINHHGQPVTEKDFLGKFMLVYFGFTHCPDICPEEMDKMATVMDALEKKDPALANDVVPIFITCDPKRDTIPQVLAYISEFHPRFVGLTGGYTAVKAAAKAYRVYFSAPPEDEASEDGEDYLVDHSIFVYFMDKQGGFVDVFGRNKSAQEILSAVEKKLREG